MNKTPWWYSKRVYEDWLEEAKLAQALIIDKAVEKEEPDWTWEEEEAFREIERQQLEQEDDEESDVDE